MTFKGPFQPKPFYDSMKQLPPWIIQTFSLLQQGCIFMAVVLVCHHVTICLHSTGSGVYPPLQSLSSITPALSFTCQSRLQDGLSAISKSSMHLEQGFGPLGAYHSVKQIREQAPNESVERLLISRAGAMKFIRFQQTLWQAHYWSG